MIDFRFVNSNGREINLNEAPYIGLMPNELFSFEWSYTTQGQAVQKIVQFEKRMIKKPFKVVISGNTDKEYRENLDKFLQLTEADINNLKMGRLYVNDYYLECYIFSSTKSSRYIGTNKTLIECTIICENGNWQSDEKWKFFAGVAQGEGETTGNGIVYPYDYMYDYSVPFGKNTIINESYLDTDFEMIFYGPSLLPEVKIGGYEYRINYELSASDYLVINSKTKTCTVVKYNGTRVNVFKYRDRNWNIFEKIKSGGNLVIISANQALDVTLFYERSEPFWGDQKWT